MGIVKFVVFFVMNFEEYMLFFWEYILYGGVDGSLMKVGE